MKKIKLNKQSKLIVSVLLAVAAVLLIVFTAAHSHTPYGVLFIILSQLWDLSNYVAPAGDGFHTNIAYINRKIPQEISLSGDSVVCALSLSRQDQEAGFLLKVL